MDYWGNQKKEFVSDARQAALSDKLHDLLEHEHRFVAGLDDWQGNFTVHQGLALEKLWRKMNYKKYWD